MARGGLCLTSDGLGLKRKGITGVCLEVVRGCLGLSDVPGGVGGQTSLMRRLGGTGMRAGVGMTSAVSRGRCSLCL